MIPALSRNVSAGEQWGYLLLRVVAGAMLIAARLAEADGRARGGRGRRDGPARHRAGLCGGLHRDLPGDRRRGLHHPRPADAAGRAAAGDRVRHHRLFAPDMRAGASAAAAPSSRSCGCSCSSTSWRAAAADIRSTPSSARNSERPTALTENAWPRGRGFALAPALELLARGAALSGAAPGLLLARCSRHFSQRQFFLPIPPLK